jgi:hypothetical protein
LAEFVEQPPRRRLGMHARVLLAETHLHVQHQAQVGHQEGVQHVAGALEPGRVVADLGAFLAAVQRLDARVDAQHPGPIERLAHPECIRLGRSHA